MADHACRWCSGGICLLCQMQQETAAAQLTGGLRSWAGDLKRLKDHSPEELADYMAPESRAAKCPLCRMPYRDLMLHFRNSHPGHNLNLNIKRQRAGR